ncbi:MAG TPA: hypothetical protein VFV94_00680 [Polyangiaceae bacterium]|nr:hypothetical protein [Polyangiaceae bacterium]
MPLVELGPSRDPSGTIALVLGIVALVVALSPQRAPDVTSPRSSALVIGRYAVLAALLSSLYVTHFLHGGPRIIDATSYFLEARALAQGHLAFPIGDPTAAFRGRFTLLGPSGLAVIFPPGYPLWLAAGFRLGAPLAMGPALAALLVVATYWFAKELFRREDAARTAALLSGLCATLRYHTADTMSHGLSALLLVVTLALAARPTLVRVALAGLAAGWLVATRPMTGMVAVLLGTALVLSRSRPRERVLYALTLLGWLTPGLVLLGLHQKAATGSFFSSTQLAYYALADGPPGCFRWGFGAGIGCRFEHGDFVKRHLLDGFGLLAALRTTLERTLWHSFDVANLAPAALLVPWVAWRERAHASVRWVALAIVGVVAAYVPFYYPGSYPGGGARFFADALPLEHALLGLALVVLRLERFAPAGLLLGFALSTVHSHVALAEREGGRPMFERREVAKVPKGLVFIATDHGFDLGHDPAQRDPARGLVVARGYGDAHDRLLWERLGRPPTTLSYDYSTDTGRVRLRPYLPPADPYRWEAEVEWPPLAVSAGWAHPDFRPCLSAGRGMHLRPAPTVAVDLELGVPSGGEYAVTLGWMADPGARLTVTLAGRSIDLTHGRAGCETTSLGAVTLGPSNRLALRTRSDVIVDYVEATPANAKYR